MSKLSWVTGLNVTIQVLLRDRHEHQNQTRRYNDGSKGQCDIGPPGKECWQLVESRKGKIMASPL